MKTKKLTLKTKTLLSLGIISALSISAIGGMFAYAKNLMKLMVLIHIWAHLI